MRSTRRVAHAPARPARRVPPGRPRTLASAATLVLAVLLPGLLGLVLLVAAPAPVSATPGVDDYPAWLKARPKDALVDPWNFYSRECTSFVAWRLNNDNGVDFTNRYLGHHWGDARIWKRAAVASGVRVDDAPAVGAVAWWSAHSAGSSLGHVAWVQEVAGSTITIEEYNYLRRGHYDRRVISRGDRSWPSGFIHVADLGPVNRVPPTVTGTARVGEQLTASRGRWSGRSLAYRYQWRAGGKVVPGATGSTFTPTAAQLGRHIRVRVIATSPGVPSRAVSSARTRKVRPGTFANPVPPSVLGSPQVGSALSADPGSWSPAGAYSYQWLVEGRPVPDAVGPSYVPRPADLGRTVSVRVTASLTGYTPGQVVSAATAAVQPGQFTVSREPSITGTAQVDARLRAHPGTWSPKGSYGYQWLADGVPVDGATAKTFTPGADQVGRVLTVRVTASRTGYRTLAHTSAGTAPIAPGDLTRLRAPRIRGTVRVGVPVRATHGQWTPAPRRGPDARAYSYQWVAGGTPIPGARHRVFTPTAEQAGKRLWVRVTASRPGYRSDTRASRATAKVAPGRLRADRRPRIHGDAFVGERLRATRGRWGIPMAWSDLRFRWYADRQVIRGAHGRDLVLTRQQVGKRIRVRVTARPPGYVRLRQHSARTAPVLRGRAGFTGTPRIRGHARVGHTLRVVGLAHTPRRARVHIQWLRGRHPIHGATGREYTPVRRDRGRRLSVELGLTPRDWAQATARTAHTHRIRGGGRPAPGPG